LDDGLSPRLRGHLEGLLLAVQRIEGDGGVCERQFVQQLLGGGDLVGFLVDINMRQDQTSLGIERMQQLGGFPEDLKTGEDTVLNARLIERGATIELDPEIRLAHVNLTSLRAYLRHLYEHGYGFGLAGGSYGLPSRWMIRAGDLHAAGRILLRYPLGRWLGALRRIARGRPGSLPGYLLLTPLVWAGLWAAATGRWVGWRARARGAPPRGAPPG
jgi:hypothetical protein